MKKHFQIASCLLLSLLIICCCPGFVFAEEAVVTAQEMMQSYEDVLLGGCGYIQCNLYDDLIEEAIMTDKIAAWYGFAFDPLLTFTSFAVTDLDEDGNPELLLKLSEDFGFELLRYDEGQVYGFPFFARAMETVTADGEIHGSNGAENFGWYRVHFTGNTMQITVVCWQYNEEAADPQYYLGDVECTETEFVEMNETLWNKESLIWTEFTFENLNTAVAEF